MQTRLHHHGRHQYKLMERPDSTVGTDNLRCANGHVNVHLVVSRANATASAPRESKRLAGRLKSVCSRLRMW